MKWLITAILSFVGLALLEHHLLVGLGCIAAAIGIVWLAVKGRRKNSKVHVYRPQAQPQAAVEVDAARRAAERDATRLVDAARRDADAQGRAAVAQARQFVDAETRWV